MDKIKEYKDINNESIISDTQISGTGFLRKYSSGDYLSISGRFCKVMNTDGLSDGRFPVVRYMDTELNVELPMSYIETHGKKLSTPQVKDELIAIANKMGLHDGTPVRCMDSEVRKISRNDTYYYNSDTDTLFLGGYPVYESSLWALKIEGWVIAQKDGERCVTNGDKYIVALCCYQYSQRRIKTIIVRDWRSHQWRGCKTEP